MGTLVQLQMSLLSTRETTTSAWEVPMDCMLVDLKNPAEFFYDSNPRPFVYDRLLLGGEGRIEATRAESQWIVAARPLCHLQYPVAYLSRLQRILPAAQNRNCVSRCPARLIHLTRSTNGTCLWGAKAPYCWSASERRAHASLLARILT